MSETKDSKWRSAAWVMSILFAMLFGVWCAHLVCEYKERPIIVQPEPKPVKPDPEPKPKPWWRI